MEIYNFEQRSPEWYEIRKGLMTASKSSTIATAGTGLETYILEIMAEYYSTAPKEMYFNDDMKRGVELEPEARLVYELENKVTVEQVGFVVYNEYFGCSPDGLVESDGLVEFKCPNDKNYLELLLSGKIKPEYIGQMQGQMLGTSREWCDFAAYNPNFDQNIWIKRVYKDDTYQEKLRAGINKGGNLIEEIKSKLKPKQLQKLLQF